MVDIEVYFKLKDLFKYRKDAGKSIFLDQATGQLTFLSDYYSAFAEMDPYFVRQFSKRQFWHDEADLASAVSEWITLVKSYIFLNQAALAREWMDLQEQYNPLWNVDGTTITNVKGKTEGLSGTDAVTHDVKQRQQTNVYGEDKTDFVKGSGQDTVTHSDVAFDSTVEKETYKDVTDSGSRTDSETRNTRTDTVTDAAHIDVDSTAYGRTNNVDYTTTETRHGNIGVTKSTELLRDDILLAEELRNFYTRLFTKIIDLYTF